MPAPSPETKAIPTEPGRMWTHIDGLEFVAIRVFDAPMALTFRAWSSCEHVSQWWGPTGWTLPVCEMDFRRAARGSTACAARMARTAYGLATYERIVEPSLIDYDRRVRRRRPKRRHRHAGHAHHRPVHRIERPDDADQPHPLRDRRGRREGRRDRAWKRA